MMECRGAWFAPGVSLLAPRGRVGTEQSLQPVSFVGAEGCGRFPIWPRESLLDGLRRSRWKGRYPLGQVRKLAGMLGREPAWMHQTSGTRPERGGPACGVTPAAQAPRAGPGSEGARE